MKKILECKFHQNPELSDKLIKTGKSTLIEENTWHDNFWGNCVLSKVSRYKR